MKAIALGMILTAGRKLGGAGGDFGPSVKIGGRGRAKRTLGKADRSAQ